MRGNHFRKALLVVLAAAFAAGAPLLASSSAVADAAMARNAVLVRALLQQGSDVSAAQGDGMTALHWAAMHGDVEMAEMLLYAGANTRATTRLGGYTPLHVASRSGAVAIVAKLIEAKADVTARTSTGATPLMLAAASGSVEAVTRLLEAGADANARETANEQTALMFAAALDRHDVVRALLARGADVHATSTFVDLAALSAEGEGTGRPGQGGPQAQAAQQDVPGVTRPFRYSELIGAQGGLTALHFASRQGALRSVHALVEGGADVNLASPGDRTSPLVIATINGHFDIAMYLLEQGADATAANEAGVTALYGAINVQWAPIAAYPQPRAHLQQQHTYVDLVKALLAKGADPNARLTRKVWFSSYNFDQSNVDEVGATPFWRAAYASDVEMMRLLVAAGADPNVPTMRVPDRRGPPADGDAGGPDISNRPPVPPGGPSVTPLQAAAGVGYGKGFAGNSHHVAPGGMMAAVRYLVEELGADVNAEDHEGNTALHHAAARGDNEMILYLLGKGADPTVVNRRGQTTVDMANGPVQRVEPFPETIALLEKLGVRNNNRCVSC